MLSRVFVEIPTLHGLLCFQGRCETQIGAPGLAVDDDVRDAERFPTGVLGPIRALLKANS